MKTEFPGIPAAALLAALCCHAAELYRVSGVVVDAETGAPHPQARLAVMPTGTTVIAARQIAGADGSFRFDLPEGKYDLRSGNAEDPQMYGRKRPDSAFGSSLIVGPGQDNSKLTFRWIPQGAVSGRIVDEAGEPVEGALVQLVRSRVQAGRRLDATAAWSRTDDRGEYRFGRLPGSTYYLAVSGRPWYAGLQASHYPATQEPSVAYALVYYPNSPDLRGATALILSPGGDLHADFTLRAVPGAAITVELDKPQAIAANVGLITDGIGVPDSFVRQERFNGVGQRLEAVPPGRYQVRLAGTSEGTAVTAQASIDVSGSDVEVKLSPKPNPSVSGTVQLKNPGAKPKGSLYVALIGEEIPTQIATAVRPDGSFLFPDVVPRRFRLAIHGTDGYFATEIHVEGAPYSKGIVDLQEGETVTVRMVASDEKGRIGGFAMSGDQTVDGALIVLAPATETDDWPAYRGFQTDSDGSFDFQNVPGGDYLLFATDDTSLEYTNRQVIRRYLPSAKAIHLEPHATSSERIPVVKLLPGM